ncbi:adenosine deaminase [Spirochaeta lutea]|nr:adenosine deaminase [Spirochaeta lutea]
MVSDKEKQVLSQENVMKDFPKVELHRHLEGTFSLETLYNISKKNGLDTPNSFEEFKKAVQFPKNGDPDFLLFLSKFRTDWYRSFDDVYQVVYNSVKDFKDDGLHYIELRFSPEHFSLQNNFNRLDITKLVVEAGNAAAAEIGVELTYLLTFNRSKQEEEDMISLYKKLMNLALPEVVGIDLAGDELNFPPEGFKRFFELVDSDGIPSTIHAGEVTPSSQIWTAIDTLHANRIGHGTSAINDPQLQTVLKDRGIALEQCITSNYQTGSWVDEQNHPLGRLFKSGVPVTINSDDPFIQDTSLSDDYRKTVRYFDFGVEELKKANHIAIDASFVSKERKLSLKNEFDRKVQAFVTKYAL